MSQKKKASMKFCGESELIFKIVFRVASMWPTEAGNVFSRLMLFIEFISSVYICQGSEREDFLPIMSKITNFFHTYQQ